MKYTDLNSEVSFLGVGVCQGAAPDVAAFPRDDDGRQMAIGVTHNLIDGEPVVVVTMILGDRQHTATFDAAQSDRFCRILADEVLWQNGQLRQKAGQAVH